MVRSVLALMLVCALAGEVSAQTLAAGSLTTNGQSVSATLRGDPDVRNVAIQVTGTWTGTLTFQGSVDGSTFVSVLVSVATTGATATTTTTNGVFTLTNSGYRVVRVAATAAMTGTAVVTLNEGYAGGGGPGGAGGGDASAANQTTEITHLAAIEAATEATETALADVATDSTHDSAASATGPQIMGSAKNTTLPTAVTDGDSVRLLTDLFGRLRPKNVCQDPELVSSAVISTASSGNVELVAASGSTVVTVCGFNVIAGGTVGVQFIAGTGSACGTNELNKTGVYPLVVNSGINSGFGAPVFKGAAGDAVCVELSTTVQIDGILTYVQQ